MGRERHQNDETGAERTVAMRLPRSQHEPGVQDSGERIRRKVEPGGPGSRAERNVHRAEHEKVGLSFAVVPENALRANDELALLGDLVTVPMGGIFSILKSPRTNARGSLQRDHYDELGKKDECGRDVGGHRESVHTGTMGPAAANRLNESGEDGGACVVRGGAVHTSRSQRTTQHAHYAWKVHVGLDAPVWVKPSDGWGASEARVIVVPPNVQHATGAIGWSAALFFEPGSRATSWRETSPAYAIDGVRARRLVGLVNEAMTSSRVDIGCFVDQVARATFAPATPTRSLDARVSAALAAIRRDVDVDVRLLAAALRLSLDRLTHLVSEQTGMPLRRHALWHRVLRVLDAGARPASRAAAAVEAGFSDHAHMTRSFRRFLGRAPSEFRAPPRVIEPWSRPAYEPHSSILGERINGALTPLRGPARF